MNRAIVSRQCWVWGEGEGRANTLPRQPESECAAVGPESVVGEDRVCEQAEAADRALLKALPNSIQQHRGSVERTPDAGMLVRVFSAGRMYDG